MNGQIIRYLSINGPSLIYSIAKDLASRSQTRIHYPTVNRRIHALLVKQYVQKAGKRTTKAGPTADLYTTALRGDFAALAGIPESNGHFREELSPKEIRRRVAMASSREGSPFVLLRHIIEEGQTAADLVDKELVPEIIKGLRNGYLNLDAADDGVICSAFASLIARKMASIISSGEDPASPKGQPHPEYVGILMRSLEKTMAPSGQFSQHELQLTPISRQWGSELKVFLRLHAVRLD